MGPVPLSAFATERHQLIEAIRDTGIDDLEILHLFDQVPRHVFLDPSLREGAYLDLPVAIGYGQTTPAASVQALYLSHLRPTGDDRVLEVGTGCGYLTALLAMMADRVFSVERVRALSSGARASLDALGLQNVALHVGDGTIGWRRYSPYDVAAVTMPCDAVPGILVDQLTDSGRMIVPVGDPEAHDLVLVTRTDGQVEERSLGRQGSGAPRDSMDSEEAR